MKAQSTMQKIKKNNSIHLQNIPKVAHFMILGENPPKFMTEMVRVNMNRIKETDFDAKLWHDVDADHLVERYGDSRLSETWEYVKKDKTSGRLAKMADFLRPLIMYVEGGVYLDTDMVPCDSLDYMVDEPGVISFPFLDGFDRQVNGAAMSSPPGHPLMKMALEAFIAQGEEISTMHNLYAAGPNRMAIITDDYLISIGMDLPPLFSTSVKREGDGYNPYTDAPEVTHHGEFWTQIADIRFYWPTRNISELSTYHLHFRSWIERSRRDVEKSACFENIELIEGFVEWMCRPDVKRHNMRFDDCGTNL